MCHRGAGALSAKLTEAALLRFALIFGALKGYLQG